jgi:hypothetical protein
MVSLMNKREMIVFFNFISYPDWDYQALSRCIKKSAKVIEKVYNTQTLSK